MRPSQPSPLFSFFLLLLLLLLFFFLDFRNLMGIHRYVCGIGGELFAVFGEIGSIER